MRWNAAFAYLDEARSRPNLTILADTLVDRILHDGERASGALTSRGELRADQVIVAAGAYGSPGILLRSGIDHLPVGEGLSDHVGAGIAWEATPRLQEETERFEERHALFMGPVTVYERSSSCAPELWDLFLFPAVEPGYAISAAVFAMKPRSRGRVALSKPDPRAPTRPSCRRSRARTPISACSRSRSWPPSASRRRATRPWALETATRAGRP